MGKADKESKREQAAAARAEFQKRKRRNALLTRLAGVAVAIAAAAGITTCVIQERNLTEDVGNWTYPAGVHRTGQIAYTETPPVGGAHHAVWQNCGIYDVPIHEEHAVHSMEHGAVWITYRPDLAADQLQQLRTVGRDDFILLSPFPGLPAPIVLSSWNHQLKIDRADDSRIAAFISRYKNNPGSTPEFGAPCSGGTPAPATANTLGDTAAPPMR